MPSNATILRRIAREKKAEKKPSHFQRALIEKDAHDVAEASIKSIYPNPGSQAYLLFDVLGFKRGKPKTIQYPKESTEDARRIIEQLDIQYPYPEVLEEEAIAYELLPPETFKPKAWTVNVHCGNGIGKTSVMGLGTLLMMTKINPRGKGLISANTYPQLKNATLPAIIEACLQYNIPFSPWRGTEEEREAADAEAISRTCEFIAFSKKWMMLNGCFHYVISSENFIGGTNKRRQSGRGLQCSWALLDEYARLPDASAFQALITRIRLKGSKPLLLITSTPNTDNPHNWVYDLFESESRTEDQRKGKISIEGSSIENRHHNEPSYVANMFANMPTKNLFLAEAFGSYVSTSDNRLIEEEWIQSALKIQLYFPKPPLLGDDPNKNIRAGLDIANSTDPDKGDESVLTILDGAIVQEVIPYKKNTYHLAEAVDAKLRAVRAFSVCYDGDGLGVGTGNNLQEMTNRRYSVFAAVGSRSASSAAITTDFRGNKVCLKDFLANERAELGWKLRMRFQKTHAVMTGQADYPDGELISIINHEELLRELRAIKFIKKNEKVILQPKEEISAALGGKSPDYYDSLTYAFASVEEVSGVQGNGWMADVYG